MGIDPRGLASAAAEGERLREVIMERNARIAELEDALRAIQEVLQKTGVQSAVATMIVATCDSALKDQA